MIHKARPLTTSRTSFTTSGRQGAFAVALERGAAPEAAMVSGERKEDLLQSAHRAVRAHAKLIERPGAADATFG